MKSFYYKCTVGALVGILLTGCVNIKEIPYPGLIYSKYNIPGNFSLDNKITANRKAKSCIKMILGLAAFGEAGAGKIAKDNQMEKIAWVDHEFMNVFLIYTRYCTIVYGN